ncbi:MAG: hypothetical protein WC915_02455 [archaeon]|jgi:very-short-patch-repair endonuclease
MNTTGPNLSGEKKIEEILKQNNIKFDRKKKLILSKDSKKYRMPDFYLEKYQMAIEYFGSWHHEESKKIEQKERARFMEKVGAYEESGIDCLYLYPEDLINAEEKIIEKINKIELRTKASEIAKLVPLKKMDNHIRPTKTTITTETIQTETSTYHTHLEPNPLAETFDTTTLKKIILGIASISLVLFLFQVIIGVVLFTQGNPLASELFGPNDLFYLIFIILIPVSIILSGIYAYKKNLSKGFIYVSVIMLVFYILTLMFFGNPLDRAIVLLVSVIAIIPIEHYMLTSNN